MDTIRHHRAAAERSGRTLTERLKELAKVRRRFGYRRLHVLLRREGFDVNHKRLLRIYREAQLHVRRRGGRKRAMGTRAPMMLPLMPNQRWSLDPRHVTRTDGVPWLDVRPVDGWSPLSDHDRGR